MSDTEKIKQLEAENATLKAKLAQQSNFQSLNIHREIEQRNREFQNAQYQSNVHTLEMVSHPMNCFGQCK